MTPAPAKTTSRPYSGFAWPEGAFALRLCLAAGLAYAAASALGLGHGHSAAISAVIVMRPYQQGALKAGLIRLGASLGGLVSAFAALWLHHVGIDDIWLMLAALAPLSLMAAYDSGWRTAMISALLILAIPGDRPVDIDVALGRVMIVGLGAVIGILVSILVLPRPHDHVIRDRAIKIAADLLKGLEDSLSEGSAKAREKLEARLRRRLMELGLTVRETRARGEGEDPAAKAAGVARHIQALCLLLRSNWRRAGFAEADVTARRELIKAMQVGLDSTDASERTPEVAGLIRALPVAPEVDGQKNDAPEAWLFKSLWRDIVVLKKIED